MDAGPAKGSPRTTRPSIPQDSTGPGMGVGFLGIPQGEVTGWDTRDNGQSGTGSVQGPDRVDSGPGWIGLSVVKVTELRGCKLLVSSCIKIVSPK